MRRKTSVFISWIMMSCALSACAGGLRLRGSAQQAIPDDPPELWALGCAVGPEAIPPTGEPIPDAPPLPQPDATQAALIQVLVKMHGAERAAWSHHTDRLIERLEPEPPQVRAAWKDALRARMETLKADSDDVAALKEDDRCFGALSELYGGVSFVTTSRRLPPR